MPRKEENTGFEQLTILFGRVPGALSQSDVERKRERDIPVLRAAEKGKRETEREWATVSEVSPWL